VTDHLCEACRSRPAPDSTICSTCADHLVSEVRTVSDYHGLAYDLDIAIAKQAAFRPHCGRPSGEHQLPIDERASDAAGTLKQVLARWARVIIVDTGAEPPADTLPGIAAWLQHRIRWVMHRPDAAQAYEQIDAAIHAARFAVDRPDDRVYAGACDCGRDLYTRTGSKWAVCRSEEHPEPLMWPVEARRAWLLDQAADFVGTSTAIARALSRYARPVTTSMIRGHDLRGTITPAGVDDRGRKLWRLGDVLAAVAPVLVSENSVG
jgi:hypothetical protein